MAELVIKTEAHVLEIGADGNGNPSVTLVIGGEEVLLPLKTVEECRSLAPLLCSNFGTPLTLTLELP